MKKTILILIIWSVAQDTYAQNASSSIQTNWKVKPNHLETRWAKEVNQSNVHKEYPRPQMVRKNWINLNGLWDYSITSKESISPKVFDGKILVPFPLESSLSGVQKQLLPEQLLWYKKTFQSPVLKLGQRLLLHFGAVDWQATVYVNGKEVGDHQGGYTNFSFDITDYIRKGSNELVVKVFDPTDSGINPHGKQVLNPGVIYYTATSGIWQTVWMETVSSVSVNNIKVIPNLDKEEVNLSIDLNGDGNEQDTNSYSISVFVNGILKAKGYDKSNLQTTFTIPIKKARLWSPDDPYLYDLKIQVRRNGKMVDEVSSYFGMRKISIKKDASGADRILLNNKYTFNLGVLDQGFWPDGLYTAPTDDALAFDIRTIKAMGFNTIRKHIKIEPERWYYYADKLGVLVWQDFVNPPQYLPEGSKKQFETETAETIDQLYSHPSIVTWVLFNERWGAYDQERLTKWVKNYDPSRLVNGHSGELLYVNDKLREPSENPYINSDLNDVHSYPNPRVPLKLLNKAQVLGEFGGLSVSVPGHQWNDIQAWGYEQMTASDLKKKYDSLIQKVKQLEREGLSGAIYTQPFDVESEENGLLTYDRSIVKIPLKEIRKINSQLIVTSSNATTQNFFLAKNVDTSDNDNRYGEFLNQYKSGKRDSVFLRRLTLMALRKKDQAILHRAGSSFINVMKNRYSKENLQFIMNITQTSGDVGFSLFMKDSAKVNAVLGSRSAERFLKSIISKEEISPNIKSSKPNWDSIQQNIANKFGKFGLEYVYGRRMLYYLQNRHWQELGKYYVLYYQTALDHSDYHINNFTWEIFEKIDDIEILKFAVKVAKFNIDNFVKDDPNAIDTYANLLYKIGNISNAIKFEQEALDMENKNAVKENRTANPVFAETLGKMQRGEKTW